MHYELKRIFQQSLVYTPLFIYVFILFIYLLHYASLPTADAGCRYVTLVFLLRRHLPFLVITLPLPAFGLYRVSDVSLSNLNRL
jgi:hypothetical protein